MDASALHGLVLLAVLAVLLHASFCDLRRREVGDADWALIFLMAAAVSAAGWTGLGSPASFVAALSVLLMAADLMWDRDVGSRSDALLYVGIAVSVVLTLYLSRSTDACLTYATVPAMYVLMTALYYLGVVRGGADAKCVIALSAVMPAYVAPGMPDTPAVSLFPPSLAVLLVAAVITALLVIVYLVLNASRHDLRFPQALMGYRMRLGDAENSFVWPMTRVQAGVLVDGTRADDSEDAFRELEKAGADTIWVTPIIPFIVPLTAGYCIVLLFGNPLFLIL